MFLYRYSLLFVFSPYRLELSYYMVVFQAAMSTVCFKEGIQIDGSSLSNIIESSNHDVRQVSPGLHILNKYKNVSP